MTPTPTTRLAPSPTGALHLGNARSFLINWALARQNGWGILLRIEDLDGPRVKPEASVLAIDVLSWLGLDWDGDPVHQSHDLAPYHAALSSMGDHGLIYPCRCTRRDIELAASAPHADDHETRYPGTCRPDSPGPGWAPLTNPSGDDQKGSAAWRLIVPDEQIEFVDALAGPQSINVQQQVGDFVVAAKTGLPAYQLAVVVDDARQRVTHVVRGDDLLRSTARQVLLYRLIGLGEPPSFTHLPLVLGPDGRRLAKRHGDTRLATYRANGVTADRIVGLLAFWSGLTPHHSAMSAVEFCRRFRLERLSRQPVTLAPEDEKWLHAG